ncbi:DUF6252 family protein [Moheibacter stercoris]|uniref:Uncharacterized protein n=1 Tax=Moheibacter stercoris TaxID=1628251 RepID=A0ABV2LTG7_9FLAO
MLLFAGLFFTISCSSDDDNPENETDTSGSFTAKVDGGTFVGADSKATLTSDYMVILSEGQDGRLLTVTASLFSGVGTYEIIKVDGIDLGSAFYQSGMGSVWVAPMSENVQEGVLNVSKYSGGKISGTFSFTGTNPVDGTTKLISEGKFEDINSYVLQ